MQKQISEHVSNIRRWLQKNQLDALIILTKTNILVNIFRHINERLQWCTGFTGSAGVAIITQEHASIFVDGRYTVQVTKQVPAVLFEYHHLIEESFLDWIIDHIPTGGKVGLILVFTVPHG
ncbi:aminopeptidase P family N-terminal domain-containing protein [Vibrio sp. PP-XX7]